MPNNQKWMGDMANQENNQIIHLFTQVTESTKSIYELMARVDERVKLVVERQNSLDNRLESLINQHNQMVSRVVTMESQNYAEMQEEIDTLKDDLSLQRNKLAMLEESKKGTDWRLGQMADFIIKLVWVVVACYIVYKLGLSTPPIP